MTDTKLHFILITIILTIIAQNSYSETISNEDCLSSGDYLRVDYIKAIKKYQSPIEAEQGLSSEFCRVNFSNGTYNIAVGSWFDAVTIYIMPDCVTPVDKESAPSLKAFKRINNETFSIEYDGEIIIFKYVGYSASDWIARTFFEGKWIDGQNRIIHFLDNSGVLIKGINKPYTYSRVTPLDWPDEAAPYSDILEIGNTKYIFNFKNNILKLYEIDTTKPYKEPKSPTFTLNRVK